MNIEREGLIKLIEDAASHVSESEFQTIVTRYGLMNNGDLQLSEAPIAQLESAVAEFYLLINYTRLSKTYNRLSDCLSELDDMPVWGEQVGSVAEATKDNIAHYILWGLREFEDFRRKQIQIQLALMPNRPKD